MLKRHAVLNHGAARGPGQVVGQMLQAELSVPDPLPGPDVARLLVHLFEQNRSLC